LCTTNIHQQWLRVQGGNHHQGSSCWACLSGEWQRVPPWSCGSRHVAE
jgi:hypothetical protein